MATKPKKTEEKEVTKVAATKKAAKETIAEVKETAKASTKKPLAAKSEEKSTSKSKASVKAEPVVVPEVKKAEPKAKASSKKTEPDAPKAPAKATKEIAKETVAEVKPKEPKPAKTAPEKVEKPVEVETSVKKEAIKADPKTAKAPAKKTAKKEEPAVEETKAVVVGEVRYNDEELEMFRRVILESREESLDELRMLNERLEDLTNYDFAEESMIYSMHMAEQGSEAMEKEKTYAQIQRIKDYIKKLDEALMRIKDKTYGICRQCGILIAKERLLAVPVTTLSASYKIHQRCPEDGVDRIEPVR